VAAPGANATGILFPVCQSVRSARRGPSPSVPPPSTPTKPTINHTPVTQADRVCRSLRSARRGTSRSAPTVDPSPPTTNQYTVKSIIIRACWRTHLPLYPPLTQADRSVDQCARRVVARAVWHPPSTLHHQPCTVKSIIIRTCCRTHLPLYPRLTQADWTVDQCARRVVARAVRCARHGAVVVHVCRTAREALEKEWRRRRGRRGRCAKPTQILRAQDLLSVLHTVFFFA
jgi:hypothetical protein